MMTTKKNTSYGIPTLGLCFGEFIRSQPQQDRYTAIVVCAVLMNHKEIFDLETAAELNGGSKLTRVVAYVLKNINNEDFAYQAISDDVSRLATAYGSELILGSSEVAYLALDAVNEMTDYLLRKNFVFFQMGSHYITSPTGRQRTSLQTQGKKPETFVGIPTRDGGKVYFFSEVKFRVINERSSYQVSRSDVFLPETDEFKVGRFINLNDSHFALMLSNADFTTREKQTTLGHKLAHYALKKKKTLRHWQKVEDSSGVLSALQRCTSAYKSVRESVLTDERPMTPGNFGHKFAKALFHREISSLKELHEAASVIGAEKLAQGILGTISAEDVFEVIAAGKFQLNPNYPNTSWPIDHEYVELLQKEAERRKLEAENSKRARTTVKPFACKNYLAYEQSLRDDASARTKEHLRQQEARKKSENEALQIVSAIKEGITNPLTKKPIELSTESAVSIFSSSGIVFSEDGSAIMTWSDWNPNSNDRVPGFGSGKIVSLFEVKGLIPGEIQLFAARDAGKVVGRIRFVRAS